MSRMKGWGGVALAAILAASSATAQPAAQSPGKAGAWPPPVQDTPPTVGALSKQNMAKPRPKPPFDLTGTWMIVGTERDNGGVFTFRDPSQPATKPPVKLKPAAQALYDEGVKANAAGKVFRDDTGNCWPAGMPKFLNRAWPIQIYQEPTVILMIQALENQLRWIYVDGRAHTNPDLNPASYNGESIARWEGDTLVVDTINFEPKRHWMETGVPISDQFHIVERMKLQPDGLLEIALVMTDPVNWEGEWTSVKHYKRAEDQDIVEVHCTPDLNDHIAGTHNAP